MMPLARKKSLFVRHVGSEVLIWDEEAKKCYCLNPLASMVWLKCDGQNTVADIAKQLETEMKIQNHENQLQSLVNLEVNKLQYNKLIEDPFVKEVPEPL